MAKYREIVHKLSVSIHNNEPTMVERRLGTVEGVGVGTIDVRLGGASDPEDILAGIPFLASYVPAVGDYVWVDIKGYSPIAIGSTVNHGQPVLPIGTSITIGAEHLGCLLKVTANSLHALPTDADVAAPIGSFVDFLRYTSTGVGVVGDTGVTVRTAIGNGLRAQYSVGRATKIGANEWVLSGDFE